MQTNTSKINTFLLIVLVILAGVLVFRPYFKNEKVAYSPTPMPAVSQPQTEEQTYTYINHGFSIELPKGFVPQEQEAEGGPSTTILLPDSPLSYISDATFWEKYNFNGYKYVRNEKIGETTWKVYEVRGAYDLQTWYYFRQGNIAYMFSGDPAQFQTFKFVGWQ